MLLLLLLLLLLLSVRVERPQCEVLVQRRRQCRRLLAVFVV